MNQSIYLLKHVYNQFEVSTTLRLGLFYFSMDDQKVADEEWETFCCWTLAKEIEWVSFREQIVLFISTGLFSCKYFLRAIIWIETINGDPIFLAPSPGQILFKA